MAYTEAQKRATMKYLAENLDDVRFRVKKGEKDKIKAEAEKHGLSMAQFITEAINEKAGKQIITPSGKE